jgi:hypothetical protein
MLSPADRYAFKVIPEDMHAGILVLALPTYLAHFSGSHHLHLYLFIFDWPASHWSFV